MDIYYYRDRGKHEVDFVLTEGDSIKFLIQSCSNLNDQKTRKRELNSLIKASENLKCDNLLIITLNHEEEIETSGKKITVKPLWKWLIK